MLDKDLTPHAPPTTNGHPDIVLMRERLQTWLEELDDPAFILLYEYFCCLCLTTGLKPPRR